MILIPKKLTWFLGIAAILAFCLSGLLINNYGLVIFGIVFIGLLVVNYFYQPYGYANRGWEQLRQGNYLKAKALEDYDRALQLNRHCAYAYYCRGITLFFINEFRAAFEDLTQALQLNLNLVFAYYNRGNARYDLGDESGAFEDYNQAEILKPHSSVYRYDLHAKDQVGYYGVGIALTRLGYNLSALEAFQKAAKLHFEWRNQPLYRLIHRAIENLSE